MVDGIQLSSHLRTLAGLGQLGAPMEIPTAPAGGQGLETTNGPTFADVLKDSIGKVNDQMNTADQSIEDLATGRTTDVHHTLIELQKADISFRTLLEVRSKVMNAYQEVMRMQT